MNLVSFVCLLLLISLLNKIVCVLGATPVQEIFRLHANDPLTDTPVQSTSRANAQFSTAKTAATVNGVIGSESSTISSVGYLLYPPRNLTVLISGLDPDGKAYVQISWLPPLAALGEDATPFTSPSIGASVRDDLKSRYPFTPVDRYRITWHDQLNPNEEFRKTINGDSTSYTIEHLTPNVLMVVEIQAFRWIDDKKFRSSKAILRIRTASRKSTYDVPAESTRDGATGSLALTDHNITVNSVFFQNGLLKANLSWSRLIDVAIMGSRPSSGYTPSFVVRWYPKVCLGNERKHGFPDQLLVKPLLTTTNINSVVVYDLNFNCRYAVAIYQRSEDSATRAIVETLYGVKHFITPMCQDVSVIGSTKPNCPKLPPRLPGPPQNLSCLFLVQVTEISSTCSWEPPLDSDQPVVGYRTMYARKMLEPHGLYGVHPFPVLDRNSLVMKVLDEDEMSFSIANLDEETEYVVHIQAISAAGFGSMARLEFITPRLIHSVALSQTRVQKKDFSPPTLQTSTAATSRFSSSVWCPVFASFFILLFCKCSIWSFSSCFFRGFFGYFSLSRR